MFPREKRFKRTLWGEGGGPLNNVNCTAYRKKLGRLWKIISFCEKNSQTYIYTSGNMNSSLSLSLVTTVVERQRVGCEGSFTFLLVGRERGASGQRKSLYVDT